MRIDRWDKKVPENSGKHSRDATREMTGACLDNKLTTQLINEMKASSFAGLFAVAAAGASVAFAAGVVALTRRRHTDALRKFVG
uniref:Reverse transcriptase domain-containing protein n=1 Tax=Panagrellus redivivus TaxID=6233 RepID=A0A7E4UMZ9_PANRE